MLTSFGHFTWATPTGKTSATCKRRKLGNVKCSFHQNVRAANLKPSNCHDDHQINKLRDVVGGRLREDSGGITGLRLVDAIQRLGIDHHFEEEIEALLQRHYYSSSAVKDHRHSSLRDVSLSFRLLRQQSYYVAPDVFNNFMKEKGRFNLETQKNDIKAVMELYEASQLSIEGEDVLDAAADFSSQILNAWTRYLNDYDARKFTHTLDHPYHKSLARFNSMTDQFEGISRVGKSLQELSYLENYMAKSIHTQELLQISKWCEDLGLARELELARDQPKKWHACSIACLSELSLSDERVDLTKTISFIYLIDDIFDLYGEPQDLFLFTQAVKRWELHAAIEELPDYMNRCFRALYRMTNEAGLNIQKKHGFNPIESLRKTWEDLCVAFLTESRWFAPGCKNLPKADEYLENGKLSSGVHVVAVHLFFLLGFGTGCSSVRKSAIILDDASSIISSAATILRLWDDLGSSKDEGQSGHDGSFVNYYVNDHEGVPVEMAGDKVSSMISDEWKRLNMDCLRLGRSSASFQKAILNLARMVPLMYNYNDGQHLPHLQHYIELMF